MPRSRQLETLKDAADYIMKLSKTEQYLTEADRDQLPDRRSRAPSVAHEPPS